MEDSRFGSYVVGQRTTWEKLTFETVVPVCDYWSVK